MSDEPRQAKPVVPKTTIARAYHKRFFKPDAHFVEQVIRKIDKEANQLRAAAWWQWKRGPFEFPEEEAELMAGSAEVNQNLRRATGRASQADKPDPRRSQLEGLAKAVGCKAVATVCGLIPETAKSDSEVVLWLDDFCSVVPHLFESDLTDRTVSDVIASAKG